MPVESSNRASCSSDDVEMLNASESFASSPSSAAFSTPSASFASTSQICADLPNLDDFGMGNWGRIQREIEMDVEGNLNEGEALVQRGIGINGDSDSEEETTNTALNQRDTDVPMDEPMDEDENSETDDIGSLTRSMEALKLDSKKN